MQIAAIALLGLVSLLSPMLFEMPLTIVYNSSVSAPVGWYVVRRADQLAVEEYVAVRLPDLTREFAAQRGYLPAGIPLLKRIGAVSGQHVCVSRGGVVIDGRPAGGVRRADAQGRPLLPWSGCRTLDADELFLLSINVGSYDSRYFGPVKESDVIGRAYGVWTSS